MSVVIYLLCWQIWSFDLAQGRKAACTLQQWLCNLSFPPCPLERAQCLLLFSSYTTTQGPCKTWWITYSLELPPSVPLNRGRVGSSVTEGWLGPALLLGTYLSTLLQADVCISGWSCSFKHHSVCGIFVVVTFLLCDVFSLNCFEFLMSSTKSLVFIWRDNWGHLLAFFTISRRSLLEFFTFAQKGALVS